MHLERHTPAAQAIGGEALAAGRIPALLVRELEPARHAREQRLCITRAALAEALVRSGHPDAACGQLAPGGKPRRPHQVAVGRPPTRRQRVGTRDQQPRVRARQPRTRRQRLALERIGAGEFAGPYLRRTRRTRQRRSVPRERDALERHPLEFPAHELDVAERQRQCGDADRRLVVTERGECGTFPLHEREAACIVDLGETRGEVVPVAPRARWRARPCPGAAGLAASGTTMTWQASSSARMRPRTAANAGSGASSSRSSAALAITRPSASR
ncbi:MAG: hypothetical protein U1F11_03705 [Steroidobacteraceae bacterium]